MREKVVSRRHALPYLTLILGFSGCASGDPSGLSGGDGSEAGPPGTGGSGTGAATSDGGTDGDPSAGTTGGGSPTTSSGSGTTGGGVGSTSGAPTTSGDPGTTGGTGGGSTSGADNCAVDLAFDFADPCPWTHTEIAGSAVDSWECGDTTSWPLGPDTDRTGVAATQLAGLYADDESSSLQSDPIDLTECTVSPVSLELDHWYDFEMGSVAAAGGIVQVSIDDGGNWETISPSSGDLDYANDVIVATHDPPNGQRGFTGKAPDWGTSVFDLSPYGGETVLIRMVFGSDGGGGAKGGWYIDAVRVAKN